MKTRLLLLALTPLALHAAEAPASLDHTSPAALNERALREMEQGNGGTAVLLLERAVLLAPYDARIRRNLDIVKAWQAGRPAPAPPSEGARDRAPARTAGGDAGLPPVPLWNKQ
jgi:hypothetical protein